MPKPYVSLTFFGAPVAQARPRAARRGQNIALYDTKPCREYKQQLRQTASLIMASKRLKPAEGALEATIRIYRSIPASWSAKKKQAADMGEILPITKPDLSNYVKGIEDALNGVVWVDDSQIVEYGEGTGKYYSPNPRVELEVWEI